MFQEPEELHKPGMWSTSQKRILACLFVNMTPWTQAGALGLCLKILPREQRLFCDVLSGLLLCILRPCCTLMRWIRVSCSCVLLQGVRGSSTAPTEVEEGSEGAGGTTDAAAVVLLTDCWKALGERSTEISDPWTARPGLIGTAWE